MSTGVWTATGWANPLSPPPAREPLPTYVKYRGMLWSVGPVLSGVVELHAVGFTDVEPICIGVLRIKLLIDNGQMEDIG